MWASLREGDWITAERLKTYPLILLAFAAIAISAMIALTHDRIGPDNQPLGTDFSQVWVAGREALAGAPEAPSISIATSPRSTRSSGRTAPSMAGTIRPFSSPSPSRSRACPISRRSLSGRSRLSASISR